SKPSRIWSRGRRIRPTVTVALDTQYSPQGEGEGFFPSRERVEGVHFFQLLFNVDSKEGAAFPPGPEGLGLHAEDRMKNEE
ncbi:MAG TPA: hypothetical protein PLL06_20835, partial [Acidobacteriota bacterium]|nr:hypothetical protein [Acidobacteriota bacterium]